MCKRCKYIFIFVIALFALKGQIGAYDFVSEGVVSHTSGGKLVISCKPILTGIDTLRGNDGTVYLKPQFKGAVTANTTNGNPMLSYYTIPITVPSEKGFRIISYSVKSTKTIQGLLAPKPNLLKKNDFTEEVFARGDDYYSSGNSEPVSIGYAGVARNRHIADLKILLTQFNPQSRIIEIPNEVTIEIAFNETGLNKKDNFQFDKYNVIETINQQQGNQWLVPTGNYEAESKKIPDKMQNLSNGTWLKIAIENEGIYKIDAQQLAQMGVTIPISDLATIKIFGNGGDNLSEKITTATENKWNEQDIIVRTKSGGELESIIFYGANTSGFNVYNGFVESFYNYYSNTNYYFLTWGGDKGKRAESSNDIYTEATLKPDRYYHRIFINEEKNNAFPSGSGKVWFGGTIFPRTFTNVLDNLDRTGNIIYNTYVAHKSDNTGTFTLSENKQTVGDVSLVANTSGYYWDAVGKFMSDTVPASTVASDNRSVLTLSYSNPTISSSTPYFNWLEILYPRSFVPINNSISFFSEAPNDTVCEYTINPFLQNDIIGFDITNRGTPKLLKNIAVTGSAFVFKDSTFRAAPRRYIISSAFQTAKIENVTIANYRDITDGYDLILITHPALKSSAEKYKQYRDSSSGIKVGIFTTDLLYNEYGSGIPDPSAIRDFIAIALSKWANKPGYVLLWGDGHYDYKGLQSQVTNFVPSYESFENYNVFDATKSYSSDDFYARIVGEDRKTDISLGRIPVDSPERGDWMVKKIKAYETKSSIDNWRNTVLLLADDSPTGNSPDGNQHSRQSETLSKYYIPEDINQKKIYLADYPVENISKGRRKPKVTADFLSLVNTSGTMLVNWVGHGNPRVWAHEEILERDNTIPMMKNMEKLFFTTAATCDFGRFDMPDIKCGAEELILSNIGASIGVFAATRVVYSGDNAEINQEFFNVFFSRDSETGSHRRLGEIINLVKQKRTDLNDEKYVLLGDPYLKILIPQYIVKIDTLNGQYVGDKDTIIIKALSQVSVSGRVLNPKTLNTEESYNGTAIITMLDADIEYLAIDVDGTYHYLSKFGGALNRNTASVINGKFSTSFIVPEDISYQKNSGRINVFSFTPDNRFASGDTRHFILSGVDTSNIGIDTQGPTIDIYMDTTSFKSGDYVSKQPLLIVNLFDAFGINSTGNGIGHRIEAWFDDSTGSYDLTDKFESSLTDSRYGSVEQYIYDLKPGFHKVKVRAWDVFNNFSISETYFRIADKKDGIIISDIYNYPNPTEGQTAIRFQHNLNEAFQAELSISTVEGRLVRKIEQDMISVHTSEIVWDGRDSNGYPVSTGAYIYNLKIRTENRQSAQKQGIAAVIH